MEQWLDGNHAIKKAMGSLKPHTLKQVFVMCRLTSAL